MKSPSIQKRIQTSIVIFITTILGISSVVVYIQMKRTLEEQTHDALKRTATILSHEIEIGADGIIEHDWTNEIRSSKDFAQSWDEHGNSVLRSPALKEIDLPLFHGELGEFVFQNVTLPRGRRGYAVGIQVIPSTKNLKPKEFDLIKEPFPAQILVVAVDTETYERRLDRMPWILASVILAIISISYFVIQHIICKGLQPLDELFQKISNKNIDQLGTGFRIQPDFPTELRGIVDKYNELLARIDRVRVRERDFAAYAAHELRTPLAGLSSTLELALSQPRDNQHYLERIKESLEITESMQNLVQRLMSLSRLQNNNTHIELESIDIKEALEVAIDSSLNNAGERNIQFEWERNTASHEIKSDRHLTHILISNLINNAVTYGTKNSSIRIHAELIKNEIRLSVSNTADTLEEGDLPKLREPFYRKDKARSRNSNNFGMGLAICQEITRVLNGSMKFHLDNDHLFTVTVTFPVDSSI